MGSVTPRRPARVSSSRQPSRSSVGPETVPLPSRSPVSSRQPLLAWCASIWPTVQYWSAKRGRASTAGALRARRIAGVRKRISRSMDSPPRSRSDASSKQGSRGAAPGSRGAAGT
ncbi:hypothetical protein A9977_04925 [Variovorax sp. UMC13]|nr:hypothetical protein [Variovorax sp. UMC13]